MDEVSDLEFSARREREGSEYLEYLTIELVIANISEIPDTRISRFFDDSSSFSLIITCEYPEEIRIFHLFTECCVSFLLYQFHDIRTLIEIITRYDNELSLDVSLE